VRENSEPERGHRVKSYVVHVAVSPLVAGLEASNHRVLRLMKMFRGVFVRRLVAAAYVPARQAESQVHPFASRHETLFASVGCAGLFGMKSDEMVAARRTS
jgi:hypothetical protein